MTVSFATTATAALPPSGGQVDLQASQNLFEHMTDSAKGMPAGASPHQIGEGLMERLNGFIDRSQSFAKRADTLTNGPMAGNAVAPGGTQQLTSLAKGTAGEPVKKVGEQQVDQIVQSLGRMFDYSIETQMVVRGATQISGAANTLLKGQ
ncbi:hypothetical protein [Pseudomonas fluorescens]|uniref:Type III secretion protein n=1 Tax=Pseudomonas fluorescens TaxID=294 RepID=A0A944DIM5_PSEFL|nr:hypothetical protein [Pseudomonas fluorescens]MBT2297575.1 hypothetical protein [Pseudomonas fluorescens]MBT2305773.1 hypothetical protein [Pseudomonas fluorescens]MBT2314204.1 hypothetical protein [Pseudomonas fluorescens]MBT2319304.1 hypothetical protein [Pseudomonas fluorescens]MBT2327514.1 hypothetical protein [Pseudomonas fluorescens]